MDVSLGQVSDYTLLVIYPKISKMSLLIKYYETHIPDDNFKFIVQKNIIRIISNIDLRVFIYIPIEKYNLKAAG